MKILVIPDIHGRDFWKEPIKYKNQFDHIIFLGDYFDPYPQENITPKDAIDNFDELINSFTIEDLEDKVEFLIGNHDAHYIIPECPKATRYSIKYSKDISDRLIHLQNIEQLVINTWITQNTTTYLFTHAGINYSWYKKYPSICNNKFPGVLEWRREVESEFWTDICQIGYCRGGEYGITGGPLWSDIVEMLGSPKFTDYYQIFGHSQCSNPIFSKPIKDNEQFACLDCKKSFIIEDNNILEFKLN